MTKKIPLAVALAAFAMACSDPTSVTRTLVPSASSLDVSSVSAYPFPLADGQVQLCKTSNVLGTYTFTASGGGASPLTALVTNPSITIDVSGETECVIIYRSSVALAGGAETITITENASAVPLVSIDIVQYLDPSINYGIQGSSPHRNDTFNVGTRQAVVKINNDMARRVVFTNTQAPTGNQGCTPGYWKQDHHFDSWNAPYDPTDDFDATFGVNFFTPNITLLDALNLGGGAGGKNQLARAAVAALLNAAEGFYPMTTAQVLAAVQGATPATYEAVKNTLDTNNNLGCTLN